MSYVSTNSMGEDLMNGMRSTKVCRYKCLLALGLKSQSTSIPFCPKGQKNFFWRPPPPYQRVGMTLPPPPPTHTHTHDRPTPAPLILRSGAGTERYHFRAAPSLVGHQIEYLP